MVITFQFLSLLPSKPTKLMLPLFGMFTIKANLVNHNVNMDIFPISLGIKCKFFHILKF